MCQFDNYNVISSTPFQKYVQLNEWFYFPIRYFSILINSRQKNDDVKKSFLILPKIKIGICFNHK